jgi:hypothetical protein
MNATAEALPEISQPRKASVRGFGDRSLDIELKD